MTRKGDKNLKKGNLQPGISQEDIDRSIPGHPNLRRAPPATAEDGHRLQAAFRETKANDERIAQRVIEDPDAALEEIHASITVLTSALLRRAARNRATMPDKALMDIVREFRQTQEALNEARRARGAVAEVQEFFAQMDARLEETASRLEACIQPAVAVPA